MAVSQSLISTRHFPVRAGQWRKKSGAKEVCSSKSVRAMCLCNQLKGGEDRTKDRQAIQGRRGRKGRV